LTSSLPVRLALELSDRRTLVTSVALLALFIVSGLIPLALGDRIAESWVGEQLNDQLEQLGEAADEGGFMGLTAKIFINNLKVSVILATLYFTIIVPIFVVVLNGMILGFLPATGLLDSLASALGLSSSRGIALVYYAGLVPHGLLELTTILLIASLISTGLRGGLSRIAARIGSRLVMAAVNLVVAAAVETIVTPIIMLVALGIVGIIDGVF